MEQTPGTATGNSSIWKQVESEENFRRHILSLLRVTERPIGPDSNLKAPSKSKANHDGRLNNVEGRWLPIELERTLANDFAFLAAVKEGARSVAACCVEEDCSQEQRGLVVRLAQNEGVPEYVKDGIQTICTVLQVRMTGAAAAARKPQDELLDAIVRVDKERIRARVRSILGYLPTFLKHPRKDPKAVSLSQLAARIKTQSSVTAAGILATRLEEVEIQSNNFISEFPTVGNSFSEEAEVRALADLTKMCYNVCTNNGKMKFIDLLNAAGLVGAEWIKDKRMSQVDKLGAYWRISRSLSQQFSASGPLAMFQGISVQSVDAYEAKSSTLTKSGKPVKCHVHAEVQIVIHYLLKHEQSALLPRVIGVSKDACFLCFLFLRHYEVFETPRTHGTLHSQWTIPDLTNLTKRQRLTLANVIKQMDKDVQQLARKKHTWRPYALQSSHNVTTLPLPSATASAASVSALLSIAEVLDDVRGSEHEEPPEAVASMEPEPASTQDTAVDDPPQAKQSHQPVEISRSGDIYCEQDGELSSSWVVLNTTPKRIDVYGRSDIEIFGEVESPSKGRARVYEATADSDVCDARSIDLGKLGPGEEVRLAGAESNGNVIIVLRGLNDAGCQLELDWIEKS